jgi:hypothetical protein
MQAPELLAQELLKALGDADEDTVDAAIDITQTLIRHRRRAQSKFEAECKIAEIRAGPTL